VQFAPPQLVLAAAAALDGAHPLAVISIPALLQAASRGGVDPTMTPVPFGSTEEAELLRGYFTLPRPPGPDRPYFAPWAVSSADPNWQTTKYPGGGLQRQRNHLMNQGLVFVQNKTAVGRDTWALRPQAGAELLTKTHALRLVDLALWFGRDVDVDALAPVTGGGTSQPIDKLTAWFISEFTPRSAT